MRAIACSRSNRTRRCALQRSKRDHPRFRAVDGTAEHTRLPDRSVALLIAAQAFHWFDRAAVRDEWRRVLRGDGLAAIFWNSRRASGSEFLERYENLLREYGIDYVLDAERYIDDSAMKRWFGAGFRGAARFEHAQRLGFDGLRGRLLSSSYAPGTGHPRHEPMLAALRRLFDAGARDGCVKIEYDTRIFVGSLQEG
ncbi:MAG TPA: methyltransferase domain-containing protein [Rudaea sp.]